MERWFLLDDGPAPGPLNMALDEILLEKVERERSAPILRLYSFDPPAITIGFHQTRSAGLDIEAAGRDGVDVVKRFTGGRALLHEGELTYCIVACISKPPFDTPLQESYMRISEALARALLSIGIEASISGGRPPSGPHSGSKPCLDSVSRHEMTIRGRKIVASAQRRTRESFLQHGSILLTPASKRIVDYLPNPAFSLTERVTSVSEELGREVDPSLVRGAVVRGFEETFRVAFERLRLSGNEELELMRRRRERETTQGERGVAV
jgi:lipoate-protein ligase A